jgi:hypothetical protein
MSQRKYSVGRGYVRIENDTALPNLPGLDQSLTEQRAIIAAFHQIHCLVRISQMTVVEFLSHTHTHTH